MCRCVGQGGGEFRPGRDDEEDGQAHHSIDGEREQLKRGRVDPVHILEHHEHGLVDGELCKLVDQGRQGAFLASQRAQIQGSIALAEGDGQERRQQRNGFALADARRTKQGLELGEPCLSLIVVLDPCRPQQVTYDRMEGAIGVIRRTMALNTRVAVTHEAIDEGLYQARFADPRLPSYVDDAPLTGLGLGPAPH